MKKLISGDIVELIDGGKTFITQIKNSFGMPKGVYLAKDIMVFDGGSVFNQEWKLDVKNVDIMRIICNVTDITIEPLEHLKKIHPEYFL